MIIEGILFSDYCLMDCVNQSSLKQFLQCPAKYRHALDNPREDSPAFATGRLWHTAILEPVNLDRDYACLCSHTQERLLVEAQERGSKAKAFSKGLVTYKEWKLEQDAREIVTEQQLAAATQGRANCYQGKFKEAIDQGNVEQSIFSVYESESAPIRVKGRMDVYDETTGMVWDLKTTRDASPSGFGRLAWSYGYVFQAGFYRLLLELEGKPFEGFHIVAVETEAPYLHGIYTVEPQATRWGAEMAKAALERLAACQASDSWPGYGSGALQLPSFAMKEIAEDLETMPQMTDPF